MKKRTMEIVDNGEVSCTVILRENGDIWPNGKCFVVPFGSLGKVAYKWQVLGCAPKVWGKVGRITIHEFAV